ncbi:hypothetical protein CICLE_v10006188mg [Citrus x clementina]|uniref:Uncharacterized protein n=2 Tax=Citrus TaxID=2706 RepID=V4SCT9_CITCL|nr:uncharacterized protein LOC127900016 [Citrus sinensis]ESR34776.1 hypothetical protein CICLE_v10006188mg [Citrus x clementina]GAY60276.1 hypothetical protein CUMW_200690 [Citrus unshiu]
MGLSKWSCQIFFLQLLLLLPLSLEVELHPIEEDSSCQCPKYQPSCPNLPIDQCHHFIQASVVQDREQLKRELIADLGVAIQSTLRHLSKMLDYSPPEDRNYPNGPTPEANDDNDVPSEGSITEKVSPSGTRSSHHL